MSVVTLVCLVYITLLSFSGSFIYDEGSSDRASPPFSCCPGPLPPSHWPCPVFAVGAPPSAVCVKCQLSAYALYPLLSNGCSLSFQRMLPCYRVAQHFESVLTLKYCFPQLMVTAVPVMPQICILFSCSPRVYCSAGLKTWMLILLAVLTLACNQRTLQ